jgi:hypothetical protein
MKDICRRDAFDDLQGQEFLEAEIPASADFQNIVRDLEMF